MKCCLVTARRRLVGTGAPFRAAQSCLVEQVKHAVDAGVDLVQVRERDLDASDLCALVRSILGVTRGTATRVVVNDRLDVALAAGADGVHLRGDSIAVDAARRIAPRGFIVGRSVHSISEAVVSAEADYLIAGTVFSTPSKPDLTAPIGIEGLQQITRSVRTPVFAIGGIADEAGVESVARAGAAGVAAIGLFVPREPRPDGPPCGAGPLSSLVERLRRRFDSVQVAS